MSSGHHCQPPFALTTTVHDGLAMVAVVGELARSYDRQCELGGDLLLDSPRPAVSRVLEHTRVDRMIAVLHRRG